MRDTIRRFLSSFSLLLLAAAAGAESLPEPEGVTVYSRDARAVARRLAGRGIELPGGFTSSPAFDAAGNEIVWRESRRSTDPLGNVHVFYRQHVGGAGQDAELFGSEVGIHTNAAGAFLYAGGQQFERVSIANRPRFGKAEAVRRASDRLRAFRGEPLEAQRPIVDEILANRVGQTKLQLVQFDGEFRLAYFTFVADEEGTAHSVIIDAESDRLLGTGEANPGSNCIPQNKNTSVTAVGIPVRTGVPNRALKASPATDRPAPFTHDGFYLTPEPLWQPSSSVYQETSLSAFRCDNTAVSFSLFPLVTVNGVPTYQHVDSGNWNGKAAGDALYHTHQTRGAFTTMGRKGWNGSNGEAKIVIDSTLVANDQAMFNQVYDGRAPANSVVIGRASSYYNLAASLDLVAHEWGHGVLFDEGFPYSTTANKQIHEGYSDVIAHIVEKLRQPGGFGLEKSGDFTVMEDAGVSGYARGALDDGTGHVFQGPSGSFPPFNNSVHSGDPAGSTPHDVGNRLSVVYRLLVEGGRNPICDRPDAADWFQGCDNEDPEVTAIGLEKANRIMFQAIYEMPTNVTLNTIATFVNEAAFNVYNDCTTYGLNAAAEQQAVADAFYAIGYDRPAEIPCTP